MCSTADVPVLADWSLPVDSVERTALVAKPTKASQAAPLVFAFHGHGGSAKQAARSMPIHKHWPEALVIYPQGLPTAGKLTDPEGKRAGWQMAEGTQGDRDLKFFDAMLKAASTQAEYDTDRVYVTGHSNGGAFTYLLWEKRPDLFAAVAPSAAVLVGMKDAKPLPCLHIGGEADALVKFRWQETMIASVKKRNGCEEKGTEWTKCDRFVATKFTSTQGDTPLVTLIGPGGHEYPKGAPELIVKFFQEHGKSKK